MIDMISVYVSIFIVRGILQTVVGGILIVEFFNPKRKNKFDVAWILLIMLLFMVFIHTGDYGVFIGSVPVFLGMIATASLVLSVGLFVLFSVRRFDFLNKFLIFSTGIVAFSMLAMNLISRWRFLPEIVFPMIFASFFVAITATFAYIDFLIKTSGGKQ